MQISEGVRKDSADNTLRDLHNPLHPTKAHSLIALLLIQKNS